MDSSEKLARKLEVADQMSGMGCFTQWDSHAYLEGWEIWATLNRRDKRQAIFMIL